MFEIRGFQCETRPIARTEVGCTKRMYVDGFPLFDFVNDYSVEDLIEKNRKAISERGNLIVDPRYDKIAVLHAESDPKKTRWINHDFSCRNNEARSCFAMWERPSVFPTIPILGRVGDTVYVFGHPAKIIESTSCGLRTMAPEKT